MPAPGPQKLNLDQAVQLSLQKQPSVQGRRASRDAAIASQEAANSPRAISGPIIHVRREQAELGVAIARNLGLNRLSWKL